MAAYAKVYKKAGESRYALARHGIRGGVQLVEMQSGRLVVRRPVKFPGSMWVETEYDPRAVAAKFLQHHGGTTNLAEIFLRGISFGQEETNAVDD